MGEANREVRNLSRTRRTGRRRGFLGEGPSMVHVGVRGPRRRFQHLCGTATLFATVGGRRRRLRSNGRATAGEPWATSPYNGASPDGTWKGLPISDFACNGRRRGLGRTRESLWSWSSRRSVMLVSSRPARGVLVGAVLLAVGVAPASAEGWRVKVQGRGADLGETPVVVELEGGGASGRLCAPGERRRQVHPGPCLPG